MVCRALITLGYALMAFDFSQVGLPTGLTLGDQAAISRYSI